MKSVFIFVLLSFSLLLAAENNDYKNNSAQLSYNEEKFSLMEEIKTQISEQSAQERQKKSGFKAAVLSAIIPGAGEFYAESYWKSAIFAALEVVGWASYLHYESRGDDKDKIMRNLGDDRWNEQRYWSRVYQISVETNAWEGTSLTLDNSGIISSGDYTAENIARLRNLETTTSMPAYFTHSLPETKTQQYYEMIYKYLRQFGSGWVELEELGYPISYYEGGDATNTPDVARYKKVRNESNDFYAIASTMSKVILVNHLISALDAAISVKQYNKSVQYSLYGSQMYYAGEYVNTYGIALSW
ncbi:MAG: hypothetical protein H6627_10075 [Calditrichae bacterium]|nr:hypothetical protein [Calditrichota bacterium]MCB9058902.1 hypothetical protein [Calditrichia bacterium]